MAASDPRNRAHPCVVMARRAGVLFATSMLGKKVRRVERYFFWVSRMAPVQSSGGGSIS